MINGAASESRFYVYRCTVELSSTTFSPTTTLNDMQTPTTALWVILIIPLVTLGVYVPLKQYEGASFFDDWDYYGFYDNTTWGNVTYLDRTSAMNNRLTYVNDAGNAVLKVDNVTNVQNGPLVYRNSARITSRDAYGFGSLIVMDVRHIPFGCSVWPSLWTLGSPADWPVGGEIDIIEGINQMNNNQMALHTTQGCFKAGASDSNTVQTGRTVEGDCSTNRGCLVQETKANSWGPGFSSAGGGVWALQIDVAGIFLWYWSRPDVPANIRGASPTTAIDTSTWGLPTGAFPNTQCNLQNFFQPQHLVLLITLCGTWAGVPGIYASTCQTPTRSCFADNVIGDGSNYDNAFWEIPYIRVYNYDPAVTPGASVPASASTISSPTQTTGATTTAGGPLTSGTNTIGTNLPASTGTSGVSATRLSFAFGLQFILGFLFIWVMLI